jgi:hypothetical protein
MTDSMNDDLGLGGLVENEVAVARSPDTPDNWTIRMGCDDGMQQQRIDDGLNAGWNAASTLR